MRKEVRSTTRKLAPRFPGNNIRLMLIIDEITILSLNDFKI